MSGKSETAQEALARLRQRRTGMTSDRQGERAVTRESTAGTQEDHTGALSSGSRVPSPIPAAEIGVAPFPAVQNGPCDLCPDLPHPTLTHCPTCHASWARTSATAHCPTCHRTFSRPGTFDKHLRSVGCDDPATIRTRKGQSVFGEPRPNAAGTMVYRLVGPNDVEPISAEAEPVPAERRTRSIGGFRVGQTVRAERAAPPKGTWANYAGRVGTVAQLNTGAEEIGVDFTPKGNSGKVSWFRPDELVRVP